MKIVVCAVAAVALSLAGCATIVTGSSQDVAVLTPVSGANCQLSNQEGNWTVVTPTAAHVQRGHDDLLIKCTKPGYEEAWTTVPSHLELWTLANIANLDVGVGVDSYTGAIDAYSGSVELPMESGATVPLQAPDRASSSTPAGAPPK
jgi:hypothetical protein